MFLALSVSVGVWLFVSGCGRLSDKGLFYVMENLRLETCLVNSL